MVDKAWAQKKSEEGYVYNSYGDASYLKYAIASVTTLRRYDTGRPIAIYCSEEHAELLKSPPLKHIFDEVFILPAEYRSITGFKHNVCRFMPFKKNLYLDGDVVACRHPDMLWKSLSGYKFTITGNQSADNFFGGPKSVGILKDLILGRRKRTLKKFNLTYLPRVQSGVMYAADKELALRVCKKAAEILNKKEETHFRSRKEEKGRSEESCEWSLAMAMAILNIHVYPWFNGYESPQLDFIDSLTEYDDEFKNVTCTYYTNKSVYNLRGFPFKWIQKSLISVLSIIPGKTDYMHVTPYFLHFGWYHQKEKFFSFAENIWNSLHRATVLNE